MLVGMGAKHIAVVSRKGEPTQGESAESLAHWREMGIEVVACTADVANYSQLQVCNYIYCQNFHLTTF